MYTCTYEMQIKHNPACLKVVTLSNAHTSLTQALLHGQSFAFNMNVPVCMPAHNFDRFTCCSNTRIEWH